MFVRRASTIVEPHPTLPECIDAAAQAIASGAT